MNSIGAYLTLARPAHWVKNGFVLVGLFFGHGWSDAILVRDALACFVGFCLVSSAVYAFNDLMDRDADRAHATKRERPLASGAISTFAAAIFSAALALAGLVLAGTVSLVAFALVLAYIVLNLGYSLGLKHVVVLDVCIIAAGFMLRILTGTLGISIEPSSWLIFCGFMLTLLLGFAKRRSELAELQKGLEVNAGPASATDVNPGGDSATLVRIPARKVLSTYSLPWLDGIIAACAASLITSYALYTLDSQTILLHGTDQLIWTLPIVAYGMGRYLWTVYRQGQGADPAAQLWRDPQLSGAVACWLLLTWWLIA
jgi:uncharacterized membrane protein